MNPAIEGDWMSIEPPTKLLWDENDLLTALFSIPINDTIIFEQTRIVYQILMLKNQRCSQQKLSHNII